MTLTKKVGSLLLLLTAGSLIGIATFAIFFSNTVVDGLYVIAAQYEQLTLAQLQIQTLRARDGQEDARALQGRLVETFDMLIGTMEDGGLHQVSPLGLLVRVTNGSFDLANEGVI